MGRTSYSFLCEKRCLGLAAGWRRSSCSVKPSNLGVPDVDTIQQMRPGWRSGVLVAALLGLQIAGAPAAAARPARFGTRYAHVGAEVTALGTLHARRSPAHTASWQAVLQQRIGGRWVDRSRSRVRALHHSVSYRIVWPNAPEGTVTVRVVIAGNHSTIARTPVQRLRPHPHSLVTEALRPGTVQLNAGQVQSIVIEADGDTRVTLTASAATMGVGGVVIANAGPTAPHGLLGVVTSIRRSGSVATVVLRPATIEDAYSAFEAQASGTLSELATTASASIIGREPRGHTAAGLGAFDGTFSCSRPDVGASITKHIDFSKLHFTASVAIPSYSNGYYGPGVELAVYGTPQLTLGVGFAGAARCEASASATIPIPGTPGLVLEIGPDFTLSADGKVAVNLTWSPWIYYGVTRFRSGPTEDVHEFRNGGTTGFSGAANLKLSLALDAGLSLAGRVGVRGSLGPEILGSATTRSSPPESCLDVNGDFAASLTAFANTFFNDYSFTIGSATFGRFGLYHHCTDGSTGGGNGGGTGGGGGAGGGGGGGGGPGGGGSGGSGTPLLKWAAPEPVDNPEPPYAQGDILESVSCPSTSYCAAVDTSGQLVSTHDPSGPANAWTPTWLARNGEFGAIDCPTTALCVAVSHEGDVFWSTDPTAVTPHWSSTNLGDNWFTGISCASTSLCVAVGQGGYAAVSTTPASGGWRTGHVAEDQFTAVSCPSEHLCVAVGQLGMIAAGNPLSTGGWSTFKATNGWINDVSCSSVTSCVAVEEDGHVITTTNPLGGSGAWMVSPIGTSPYSVACPSESLCLLADFSGSLWRSEQPLGSATSWHEAGKYELGVFPRITCHGTALCVSTGFDGHVATTTDPGSIEPHWSTTEPVAANRALTGISCPSAGFCVAIDAAGNVVTSTDPSGGESAWTTGHVGETLQGVGCAPATFVCAADGFVENLMYGTTEAELGAGSWNSFGWFQDGGTNSGYPTAISCASRWMCAAATPDGYVLTSKEPGNGGWVINAIAPSTDDITGVSCPAENYCAAVDTEGNVFSSDAPDAGAGAWSSTHVTNAPLLGISCPTTHLCVAVNDTEILASRSPGGGASTWTRATPTVPGFLGAVSCATERMCVVTSDWLGAPVFTSSEPANPADWVPTTEGVPLGSISCPTATFCAGISRGSVVIGSP
jgi:uncharacterized membrane protein YgcG